MKFLKRTMAIITVLVMISSSCMAASITSATYDNGKINVTTDGYTSGQQATVLVVKSGVELSRVSESDIVYIQQVTVGNESPSLELPVADRAKDIGATEVQLFMGGTDINTVIEYKNAENKNAIAITSTPVVVTAYEASLSTTTFAYNATEDTIKAAVVVKKTVTTDGVAAAPVVITEGYTSAVDMSAKTVTVTFPDGKTGVINFTLEDAPSGRTAVAGVVKARGMGSNYSVAQGALVLVTNGATIVGSAVTDANGAFDITVPAGTYKVIIRYAKITATAITNYANTVIENVEVKEDYVKNLASEGADFIKSEKRLVGDANDDGKVTNADYNDVTKGLNATTSN